MRVSVIIPTLNEEQTIAVAIQSARSASADEVIVVDGGSQDKTVELAAEMATAVMTSGCGRAIQQNAGAAVATGEILVFLHADCRLAPESLTELRQRMQDDPLAAGGYLRQRIDAEGRLYRLLENGNHWRARLFKWAYGDQAICVRASRFQDIGGFPSLALMEDLYLMKRLRRHGRILALQSTVTVSARRWQQHGIVRQTLRNWLLITAAHLGISPNHLSCFYPNDR